jgi:hypothetical protein
MERFEVTISYRAVITVDVKADSEEEAREIALEKFKTKERKKWYQRNDINLQDDNFKASGSMNMTESWDMLYE